MRSPALRSSANRRPGILPGRRVAFALATALAGLAWLAGHAAAADPTVATATIYPGPGASIKTQTVSLSTLNGCTPYTGASPMYLYPPFPTGQPFQVPTSSSWSLSTVLTCGLGVPLTDLTNVQVVRSPASRGLEDPLTSAQLTDASQWQAAGALPVISTDGSEDQTTYTRPWRGGHDDNGADQVTVQGEPIAIAVYESGPPLKVTASQTTLSRTPKTVKVRFAATVRDSHGANVSSSSITWNWSFGDGASSNAPSPMHAFAPGDYPVTVQVTDTAAGTGGTDTIQVVAHTSNQGTGSHGHSGGGKHTKSRAPTGPDRSRGTHPGEGAGSAKGSGAGGSANGSGTNGATPGAAASQSTGGAANSGSQTASDHVPAGGAHPTTTASQPPTLPGPHHQADEHSRHVTITASAPVVRGRLISDVTPLSPAGSALVHGAPPSRSAAPQVRQATTVSLLPALLGGLAVIGLLALGAAHEFRGRGWGGLRAGG